MNQSSDLPPDPEDVSPVAVEAFAAHVREHQAGLRAFIRAIGVEADWVDDLAQEVFIIAFRRQAQFDRARDFGRWLRGIARHHVANERRKEARRARLLSGALTEVLLESGNEHEAAESVAADRLVAALDECVGQLPERSRALLRRRYEGNETSTALAEAFHQTAESLRQTLLRLRLVVKRCVEGRMREASR